MNNRIIYISWKIILCCEEISNFGYKFLLCNDVKLHNNAIFGGLKIFLLFKIYSAGQIITYTWKKLEK